MLTNNYILYIGVGVLLLAAAAIILTLFWLFRKREKTEYFQPEAQSFSREERGGETQTLQLYKEELSEEEDEACEISDETFCIEAELGFSESTEIIV